MKGDRTEEGNEERPEELIGEELMGEFTSEGATSQRWETIKMEKKLPKLIPLVVLFVAN